MKSKLPFLILFLAVLTSCKKIVNIEVTVPLAEKFTYKLLDDAGKGLSNVKVSIFEYSSNENRALLYEGFTDKNGIADFGKINSGFYFIKADSPEVNNVKYPVQQNIQLFSDKPNHKEVKVSDFSATFNFTVVDYSHYDLPINIGMLMIPKNKFKYGLPTTSYFDVADYKGACDDKGFISFQVPSNKDYISYLYNITTNNRYQESLIPSVQTNVSLFTKIYISQ